VPDSTATQATELLNADTAPATPAAEPAPAAPADAVPAAAPPESFYLTVNDRTKYRTAEDAVKGFQELQEKYSGWSEISKAWGDDLKDPKYVNELLTDLANRRAAERAAQATPTAAASSTPSKATIDAAAAGDKAALDSLTPEWKAHVEQLNKIGYVTKDALQPLQQQIAALASQRETERQAAEQQHQDAAVREGTGHLEKVMKEAGFTVTDESLAAVGKRIGAQINNDSYDAQGRIIPGSLGDQYLRGDSTVRAKIIADEFSFFKSFAEGHATSKTASYVKDKNAAQASQPRTLPQGSSSAATPRTGPMTADERKTRVGNIFDTAKQP
jgi:hypothetical protein